MIVPCLKAELPVPLFFFIAKVKLTILLFVRNLAPIIEMDCSKRFKLSQLTDEEIAEFMEALDDGDDRSEDEVSEDQSEAEELVISDGDFDQMDNYIEQLENASTSDFLSTATCLNVDQEAINTSKFVYIPI